MATVRDPVEFLANRVENSTGSWNGRGLQRLSREFFDRPSTEVAPDLLGCVFWHEGAAGLVAVRLVEVEAYQGLLDRASHAFRGRTARNAVMFGPPGHVYVYFTYGMHFCANLVCQPAGQAEAVLLRAGEVICGLDLAASRREAGNVRAVRQLDLARGPARLCQALGIDRAFDGADVCTAGSALGIGPAVSSPSQAGAAQAGAAQAGAGLADSADNGAVAAGPARTTVRTGPRVGVSQAADRPWRYWLAEDGYVSPYRAATPRSRRRKPVAGRDAGDGTMQR